MPLPLVTPATPHSSHLRLDAVRAELRAEKAEPRQEARRVELPHGLMHACDLLRPRARRHLVREELIQDSKRGRHPVLFAQLCPKLRSLRDEYVIGRGLSQSICEHRRRHFHELGQGHARAGSGHGPRVHRLVEAARCDDRGAATSERRRRRAGAPVVHGGSAALEEPLVRCGFRKEHVPPRIFEQLVAIGLAAEARLVQHRPATEYHRPESCELDGPHRQGCHELGAHADHGAPADVHRRRPRGQKFRKFVDACEVLSAEPHAILLRHDPVPCDQHFTDHILRLFDQQR
mmetsp:Transcript_17262/g.49911  ORF Transcript_17262/g.49911 Transcript_17262/m.49911 type:complete len:290 (+) Transcript_17262:115-984(+)